MKRSFLFLFAALFALTAPLTPARADVSVPVDFFYDALSQDGDWIYVRDYGYVWQPIVAQQNNWAPYSDGYWAFTDAGWTWISNENFGWITYHYGRWMRLRQNWVWVPGYEWAPAWVSWRQTQGQIGWAPLPPEAAWVSNIGFGGWTDSYYDVGPSYYNFVPIAAFASRSSLNPFIMDRNRNFTFYDQSVNITHTNYRENVPNHIFVGGPDPARIDRMGSNHVRRLTLRHDDDGFRREWIDRDRSRDGDRNRDGDRSRGNFSRIEKDHFVIAAPSINRDGPQRLPSRVREHMNQVEVDRGWRGAPDSERMREHQRDELARTRPANLPDKKRQPVTSMTPPPAVGRVLNPEERGADRQRDSRQAGEEVRPAVPIPGKGRPGAPGTPPTVTGEPGRRGDMPPNSDTPPRDRRPGGLPGVQPGERPSDRTGDRPGGAPGVPPTNPRTETQPTTPPSRRDPEKPVPPPQTTPGMPGNRPDSRDNRPGSPGSRPDGAGDRPDSRGNRPDAPGNRPDAPGDRPDSRGNRPDAPGNRPDAPGDRPDSRGNRPDAPGNREGRPGMGPGGRPGGAPVTPPSSRREPQTPVNPPQTTPNPPGNRPDFPGNREGRPGRPRTEAPPSQPNVPPPAQSATPPPSSRERPAPMPQPQTPPQTRPMPAPSVNNPPRATPTAPPQAAPPAQSQPRGPNRGPQGQGERPGRKKD